MHIRDVRCRSCFQLYTALDIIQRFIDCNWTAAVFYCTVLVVTLLNIKFPVKAAVLYSTDDGRYFTVPLCRKPKLK
jgi:hypothetical protein